MLVQNVDGKRVEDGRYARFTEEISAFIPKDRQFSDPVRTFAYGTDASFYRLNPKLVIKASVGVGCPGCGSCMRLPGLALPEQGQHPMHVCRWTFVCVGAQRGGDPTHRAHRKEAWRAHHLPSRGHLPVRAGCY